MTIKNVWKKPVIALLSFSILTSISTACLAEELQSQDAMQIEVRSMTKEEKEELAALKRRFLYNFLNHLTKSLLAASESWDGSFDLSSKDEKTIKEADAFYSNEENQKLLRGLSNFPNLSKEEEEALKKSLKYLAAFAGIKRLPI